MMPIDCIGGDVWFDLTTTLQNKNTTKQQLVVNQTLEIDQ